MGPQIIAWKEKIKELPERKAEFEKWLFINLAGVLAGSKSGELLVLRRKNGLEIDEQIKCIGDLAPIWSYSYLVLLKDKDCSRVIIYKNNKVQRALSLLPKWVLDKLGYSHDLSPEDFLKEVSRRWYSNNRIPHEIAFALGYPIKDVLGYMGLISLPSTGICGWRIHGDPEPSILKSREFKRAKKEALEFLMDC